VRIAGERFDHLIPTCLPLVYDVHHHRCLGDGLSVERATADAVSTWNREPLFHISSPREGWHGPKPERHHDYINPADFPDCWQPLTVTVEVEAKAKELAVLRLQRYLRREAPSIVANVLNGDRGRNVGAEPAHILSHGVIRVDYPLRGVCNRRTRFSTRP
jgi:hypothetical protein